MTVATHSLGRATARWLATGFGIGHAPIAPGTFGTVLGIGFYLLVRDLSPILYLALVCALFVTGIRICQIAAEDLGQHDHPAIVWDEIVGLLISLFLAPPGWAWILVGFIAFRVFDIWKPFPIRTCDQRVRGGFGCMLDDALAGLYSLFVVQALYYFSA